MHWTFSSFKILSTEKWNFTPSLTSFVPPWVRAFAPPCWTVLYYKKRWIYLVHLRVINLCYAIQYTILYTVQCTVLYTVHSVLYSGWADKVSVPIGNKQDFLLDNIFLLLNQMDSQERVHFYFSLLVSVKRGKHLLCLIEKYIVSPRREYFEVLLLLLQATRNICPRQASPPLPLPRPIGLSPSS